MNDLLLVGMSEIGASRSASGQRIPENFCLLQDKVNRQHLLRLLSPASGLKRQPQRDRQPLREEVSQNRSPLPAPATREDVEVQRADRILPNEPGDVSSAWHPLL